MNAALCVGIYSQGKALEVAAIASGRPSVTASFPATGMGIEAIRVFLLSSQGNSVRLAVAGAAALSVALALGSESDGDVFIVSPSVACHSVALAKYAGRAI
ncbi:MAG: hypothetical protein WBP72_16325 [Rhodocyclaceae bacterium]